MKRYQDDFKASIVKMHREEKRSIRSLSEESVFLQPQFITGLKALNQLS